jgi:unsaturated rhamnogalacturonyl hydrolase
MMSVRIHPVLRSFMHFGLIRSLAVSSLLAASLLQAQATPPAAPNVGDSLNQTPALANLSPALKKPAVAEAMRKVADWQMARTGSSFSRDWTFAALYDGYMAAAHAIPEPRYEATMLAMGNSFDWTPGPRKAHADDQAIAQTYLGLFFDYREPRMIIPTQQQFNVLMTQPDDPAKPVWWWCDALFMAPPVWARLYTTTHDKSYLDYMDREWWITSKLLYDPQEHLFFRDATFLTKHEANGQKLFWSRGNGWVMAGLARVLEQMPADYPTRSKYVEQFQQMAQRVAQLQGKDGLWRPGLLDADAYPLPEVSGSAFFIYAMAWGINQHILDRATYLPVVTLGWQGLLQHVYDDGRLGAIQPIGSAPGAYTATSSYVYGVGAFLLAGSEVMDLSKKK